MIPRLAVLGALPTFLLAQGSAPPSLSLGEAIRYAAARAVQSQVGALRVQQAAARSTQRRADLLPSLSLSLGENARTFNTATLGFSFRDANGRPAFDPNGQVIGPVRVVDARGTLRAPLLDWSALERWRAARASADVADAEAAQARDGAGGRAALAWLRTTRAMALIDARASDSTLAAELLDIARQQLQAGVGVALDVTRANSQYALARAQLLGARNELARARLDLASALGLAREQLPLLLPLSASTSAPLPTEAEAVQDALARRADIRALDTQTFVARRQLAAIRGERIPALTAYRDQGAIGGATAHLLNTYTWSLGVSVGLFDGFRREGRVQEQQLAVQELTLRAQDQRDLATTEVRSALLDAASATEQLAAATERLGFATQELEQARERFRAGVASNADVITASLSLNAARTLVIDARMAHETARVALARASGRLTELP
ncbi:MAG: TolC family protein [Gemmatimonadaceae bacterium]|nr:TolC family protein [Gemmatimonadaceae bacterium]